MPHALPDLPYGYDALEPVIDEETLRIHHGEHHAGYVAGLNKAEAAVEAALLKGNFNGARALQQDLAFFASGHVLHALYWRCMRAPHDGAPPEVLAGQLRRDFGSVAAFQALFSAAAGAVEGSGWGVLAWDPSVGALRVLQAEKHQNLALWGAHPILVCDVWEHAYYLKYRNRRSEYVSNWWRVVDWAAVASNLAAARGGIPG